MMLIQLNWCNIKLCPVVLCISAFFLVVCFPMVLVRIVGDFFHSGSLTSVIIVVDAFNSLGTSESKITRVDIWRGNALRCWNRFLIMNMIVIAICSFSSSPIHTQTPPPLPHLSIYRMRLNNYCLHPQAPSASQLLRSNHCHFHHKPVWGTLLNT